MFFLKILRMQHVCITQFLIKVNHYFRNPQAKYDFKINNQDIPKRILIRAYHMRDKVFKNGQAKIYGRQPLKDGVLNTPLDKQDNNAEKRCSLSSLYYVNTVQSNISFLQPLKTSKTKYFLTFSGTIEMEHWAKVD